MADRRLAEPQSLDLGVVGTKREGISKNSFRDIEDRAYRVGWSIARGE